MRRRYSTARVSKRLTYKTAACLRARYCTGVQILCVNLTRPKERSGMKFLKLVLLGIVVVFLAFIGMKLVGVAIKIMSYVFFPALIGLAAMELWKMCGPKGAKRVESREAGR